MIKLYKLYPESGSSAEETIEQHIGEDSEILSEINTDDNAFKVSLDITASGDALASLSASESEYSSIIESDMVVGVVPEFECEEGAAVDDVVLNFAVDDSFIENTNGKYADVSDDFEGIKRFNVFKYFDDIGMLLPVETTYENNTVTTHVDELGTYCLVDMEKWLEKLDVDPSLFKTTPVSPSVNGTYGIQMNTPPINTGVSDTVTEPEPLDVILHVYVQGDALLKQVREDVKDTADKLFDEYNENGTLRVYVAIYTGTFAKTKKGNNYATNKTEAAELADRLASCSMSSDMHDLSVGLSTLIKNYNNFDSKRANAEKYYVFVEKSPVEIADSGDVAKLFDDDNEMNPVVVTNFKAHKGLADYIKGYYHYGTKDFGGDVSEYIINKHGARNKKDDDKFDYPIMTATGWNRIELGASISDDYEVISERIRLGEDPREKYISDYADTDKDGLLDLEEIRYLVVDKNFGKDIRVTWDEKGNVVLPTLAQVMQMKSGLSYIEEGIKGLPLEDFGNFRILPLYTNPAEKDTDGDEFEDGEEMPSERRKFSSVTIDDKLLDDSDSINGNNPTITQDDLDKMLGRVYADQTTVYDGDDIPESAKRFKNELVFKRTRKYGMSDAKFTIIPSRSSDFAFTVTGTKELKSGEGATADDYSSTVRISYKKSNKKVASTEITLSNYGRSITYVFALEAGIEYSISVNNPTNNHEGEYEIHVSEDNWVYAPFGGIKEFCNLYDSPVYYGYDSRFQLYQVFYPGELSYDLLKRQAFLEKKKIYENTGEEKTEEEIQDQIDSAFLNNYDNYIAAGKGQIEYDLKQHDFDKTMLDAIRKGNNDDISFASDFLNVLSAGSYICYVGDQIKCFSIAGEVITLLTIPANLYVWTRQSLENELSDALIANKLNFIISSELTPIKNSGAEGGFYSWNNNPYIYRYYENEIYKEEYIDITHVYKRGVKVGISQNVRCKITAFKNYEVIE